MFQHLVGEIAQGTNLRPAFHALTQAWNRLPRSRRLRFRSLDRFAYAKWSAPARAAFPWHRMSDSLGPIAFPYTAQIVFKSGDDPAPHTWELLGFCPAIRNQLARNLQSIESIPVGERVTDIAVLHREIVTAYRIEEMALHRQVNHLTGFLESCRCRILHVRGVDEADADAALRRQPFRLHAIGDCRTRLRHILEQFFALTPLILKHPSPDATVALRDTGADQLISFHPDRPSPFELEPVLKAECDLYLTAGVLELDIADLRLTIEAVIDVLEQRFCARPRNLARASA